MLGFIETMGTQRGQFKLENERPRTLCVCLHSPSFVPPHAITRLPRAGLGVEEYRMRESWHKWVGDGLKQPSTSPRKGEE